MNKIGMVLGVAAVVSLAGCKDPDYKYGNVPASQNEAKPATSVSSEPIVIESTAPVSKPANEKPIAPVVIAPIAPQPVAPVAKPSTKAETTTYIVQRGDSLSKISEKYNIRIEALRKANPKIKKDVVRIGQKLNLPGKVEVGAQSVPAGSFAKPVKVAKAAYAPYKGATKEYVVKSGDSLGSIAYSNGINIRQLKELNALSKDSLQIGQKIKIPAEKVVKAASKTTEKSKKDVTPAVAVPKTADASVPPAVAPAPEANAAPAAAENAPAAPVAEAKTAEAPAVPAVDTTNYVVQEADDITGIAIRWGISAARIRELNNMADDAQLTPGQIIKLPAEAQQ